MVEPEPLSFLRKQEKTWGIFLFLSSLPNLTRSGDLVLFVMIGSQFDLPAADLIGAFKTLCGGTLDKELSK